MKVEWLRRPFGSLFSKLLLIMFVSGILIVSTVSFVSWLMHIEQGRNVFRRNMNQYVSYLVKDLGSPPNRVQAEKLSKKLFINIHYQSPETSWKTSGTLPSLEQYEFRKLKTNRSIDFGRNPFIKDRVFRVKNGDQVLYIFYQREKISETGWMLGIILAVAILFLIFLTYLALRWVLQPVHWLSGGVEALAQGQLEHRVRSDRHDELGRLARGFNRMAERISTMLSARKQLLLDVSHELRSPLSSLLGFIETMRGPARDDRKASDRFLEIMEAEAKRMTRLINELLALSKVETEEHIRPEQLVKLGPILVQVADILLVGAKEREMDIVVDAPEDLPPVLGDEDELIQVFQNLVSNAINYGRVKTAIDVRLDHSVLPDEGGAGVSISVTNIGEGIPEEDIQRLTERFYRVDKGRSRSMGGTGLGLAIVKHIVARHRGELMIKSEPGNETTFAVLLPVASDKK